MARYIDADEALKFIRETNVNYHWLLSQYSASWIYDFIESRSVADVIPKSEVDQLQGEVECLRDLNRRLERFGLRLENKNQELIKQIDKVEVDTALEVAREIFEELEYHSIDGKISIYSEYFAELKKKYAEDKIT